MVPVFHGNSVAISYHIGIAQCLTMEGAFLLVHGQLPYKGTDSEIAHSDWLMSGTSPD